MPAIIHMLGSNNACFKAMDGEGYAIGNPTILDNQAPSENSDAPSFD